MCQKDLGSAFMRNATTYNLDNGVIKRRLTTCQVITSGYVLHNYDTTVFISSGVITIMTAQCFSLRAEAPVCGSS